MVRAPHAELSATPALTQSLGAGAHHKRSRIPRQPKPIPCAPKRPQEPAKRSTELNPCCDPG